MIAIAKIIAVSLTLMDVRVATLEGKVAVGTLKQLDADSVAIASAQDPLTTIPLADVIELKFDRTVPEKTSTELLQVVLRDGSLLPLQQAESSVEAVTGTSELLGELKVPRSHVRALRLQERKKEWQPQWDAFLERKNEKDLLIVAKRDGTGLDFLSGVVSGVGADEVPFLLDGDEIPVPRTRVFGVVFAMSDEGSREPSEDLSIQLAGGCTVRGTAIVMEGDQFQLVSSWGQQLSVAGDQVLAIDFSSGRLHYLSDLEPLRERYFGLDPPGKEWGTLFSEDAETRTGLSSQWRMSRDRFANNGRPPLMLRGQVYRKGLCLFPSVVVEYALDGRYSRMTAVVGVDDDVAFNQQKGRPPTAVELRVEADGQEILKRLVIAPDDPFMLDLDLTGVTTLAVIVDFGDGESTCDYLDLADAKLIVDTSKK